MSSRPTGAARPLRRDAEDNRRRVVQAAREVFAARGLQATLNDVAHHAGLGVGTVYRRFPDKETLADAVFADELDEIAAMAREALDEDDAFAALAGFLERALERASRNRALREVMERAEFGGEGLGRARREIAGHCETLIDRARSQGALRDGLTAADIPPIAAMINAVLALPESASRPLWRRYLAVVLDGLRAGEGGRQPLPD
ncbi:helix-turn-helix domain-containing protein [Streptomyces sp. NPDC051954]|uniref:TetR/AcrR family transcriptional regulator n=1 Tax=Streptomyces sp. NPDC051954 TaxID=3155524 RepID=UPI003417D661